MRLESARREFCGSVVVVVVFITLTDQAPTFLQIETTLHAVANPVRVLLNRKQFE